MATRPTKRLALVIHGIGEQSPGETLDRLVGAATGNRASNVQSEKRLLRDEHDDVDPRAVDLFDCEIRKVETDQSTLVFAEVYWADLSRGRAGRLVTLYELIKGILGLGHLVRENAEELHPSTPKHWLGTLANLIVAMIHGPVAVLNLLLALGAILIYAAGKFLPEDHAIHVAIAILAIAATVGGYFARKKTDSYLFAIFADWLFWLGIALLGVVVVTVSFALTVHHLPFAVPNVSCDETNSCQLVWYALIIIAPLNLAWLMLLAAVVVINAVQGWRDWKDGQIDSRSIYAVVCAVMTLFWLVAAGSFWASLSVFLGNLPGGSELKADLLKTGTSLNAVSLTGFAIVVVVAGAAWLQRVRWAKTHNTGNFSDHPLARLIFNQSVQRAFIFAMLLLGTAAALLTYSTFAGSNGWPGKIVRIISENYPIALAVSAALGALYSVAWSQFAAGLGIAKDIITYFKGEPSRRNSTRPVYPLRARMHHRFVLVMESMIASEKPDEVVVIAHSQGTVIAIEALRTSNTSMLFDTKHIKKRTLITMGSPYSHIYEHYFPSKFSLPTDFNTRLDAWINIFRIDDFVGTIVGPADGAWPQNIPVNPRGHTGYWTDDEVLDVLVPNAFPELR